MSVRKSRISHYDGMVRKGQMKDGKVKDKRAEYAAKKDEGAVVVVSLFRSSSFSWPSLFLTAQPLMIGEGNDWPKFCMERNKREVTWTGSRRKGHLNPVAVISQTITSTNQMDSCINLCLRMGDGRFFNREY